MSGKAAPTKNLLAELLKKKQAEAAGERPGPLGRELKSKFSGIKRARITAAWGGRNGNGKP